MSSASKNPSLLRRWKQDTWDWWDSLTSEMRESIERQTERASNWKKKTNKNTFRFVDPLKFITKDE